MAWGKSQRGFKKSSTGRAPDLAIIPWSWRLVADGNLVHDPQVEHLERLNQKWVGKACQSLSGKRTRWWRLSPGQVWTGWQPMHRATWVQKGKIWASMRGEKTWIIVKTKYMTSRRLHPPRATCIIWRLHSQERFWRKYLVSQRNVIYQEQLKSRGEFYDKAIIGRLAIWREWLKRGDR